MTKVLFVCMGNICRSPAGEAILKHMAKEHGMEITVASCGLGDWHVGQLADIRMRDAAKQRGWVLESYAQQFKPVFFEDFDLILAADQEVLQGIHRHARSPADKQKIYLMTAFCPEHEKCDVPDPYFGNDAEFERVLDLLEASCLGLLSHIKKSRHGKTHS